MQDADYLIQHPIFLILRIILLISGMLLIDNNLVLLSID